jgi:translation elongation factor P/translation initiation factor 5A
MFKEREEKERGLFIYNDDHAFVLINEQNHQAYQISKSTIELY